MQVKTPRVDSFIDIANDEGIDDKTFCESISDFARKLESENIALQQQIEKMKCCMNCEHSNGRGTCVGITMEEWRECFDGNYAKWRLRE